MRDIVRAASSRVVAALAAAAILVAMQASNRAEPSASVDAGRAVASAASLVALHSVPTYRLALDLRSSGRWASSVGTPLPARVELELPPTVARRIAISSAIEQRDTSVAARGYDATAPPALS